MRPGPQGEDPETTLETLPDGIQNSLSWQVRQHSQTGKPAASAVWPFITISKQYGCEGFKLANLLAKRPNLASPAPIPWVVMGKEVVEEIAEKKGDTAKFVDALNTSCRSFIRQTIESLLGGRPTEYQAYETLAEVHTAFAGAGRVILLGCGGGIVCGGVEAGVHVRLIAPLSWRAKKIATERKIDAHEAEAIAVREERQREAFVRDFTGEGVADPPRHDVVFNSAQVEIETVAEAIFSMMKNKRLT